MFVNTGEQELNKKLLYDFGKFFSQINSIKDSFTQGKSYLITSFFPYL